MGSDFHCVSCLHDFSRECDDDYVNVFLGYLKKFGKLDAIFMSQQWRLKYIEKETSFLMIANSSGGENVRINMNERIKLYEILCLLLQTLWDESIEKWSDSFFAEISFLSQKPPTPLQLQQTLYFLLICNHQISLMISCESPH